MENLPRSDSEYERRLDSVAQAKVRNDDAKRNGIA